MRFHSSRLTFRPTEDYTTQTCLAQVKWGAIKNPRALEQEFKNKIAYFEKGVKSTMNLQFFCVKKPSGVTVLPWYTLEHIYTKKFI